jgi:hypothetical protein
LSSPHLEASPATTFRACSSPAPTPVKPQPAPAILSQESIHTTLSITHHTRKRPSTGPRTTHGPHLSHPLFTCTNANQAATCTYNTRPRVNLHHVVNHSSHQGATMHQSSDAPVLIHLQARPRRSSGARTDLHVGTSHAVRPCRPCSHAVPSAARRRLAPWIRAPSTTTQDTPG